MTREEFDKLYLGRIVHCDTEEKTNEFLALADSVGYKWVAGNGLVGCNYCKDFVKEICYNISIYGLTFCYIAYFEENNYQIIEYQLQSKFELGDKVRVKNTVFTNINGKVGVIEDVDSLSPMSYSVKVGCNGWTLWFYENQLEKVEEQPKFKLGDDVRLWYISENELEKVEEPTYKDETIDEIIGEIKTKWSEINILLNRLEKKEKGE